MPPWERLCPDCIEEGNYCSDIYGIMLKKGDILPMTSHKKNKFDCAEIEKYVHQYLDGVLDTHDLVLFEEHLEYCLPCDKKIEFEKKLKDTVRLKVKSDLSTDAIEKRVNKMLNDLH